MFKFHHFSRSQSNLIKFHSISTPRTFSDIKFWSYTPSWKDQKVPYICGVGASSVSTGMKAQTPKWISFANLSRKLEIPAASPDF
jgi:hypothetical protein